MKLNRKHLRRLIESVINEKEGDSVKVASKIKKQNTGGSSTKSSSHSKSKDLETGRTISQDNITGVLENGVKYGITERSMSSGDGIEKHHNKVMWIGKNDNSLGITFNDKDDSRKKIGFTVGGKSANAAKFIIGIGKLKIKPKELINVIKNVKSDLDVAEIDKQGLDESLSRGSLYRRRYSRY